MSKQAAPSSSVSLDVFSPAMVQKTLMFVVAIAGVSLTAGVLVTVHLAQGASWTSTALARWLPWLVLLGCGSFFFRFLRWHALVRQLAPNLNISASLRTYISGFAMGLTPGRVGEFCKFVMLRGQTGVREAESAPVFLLERATEAASFASLATAGALIGHFQPARLGLGTVATILAIPCLAVLALALRFVMSRSRIEGAQQSPWVQLARGVQAVAGLRVMLTALLCAGLARCCDATLFWVAAQAAGLHITLAGSALAFGIAGLTGGFSLLPAGVGAVEASLVATVSALGGDPSAALAAALLARCVTLWMWIPGGLVLAIRYGREARLQPAYATVPNAAVQVEGPVEVR